MAQKILTIVPHKTNTLDERLLQPTNIFQGGSIIVTTNLEPKKSVLFTGLKFSEAVSLDDLAEDTSVPSPFNNSGDIDLNIDKRNAKYFAKYGSMMELVRVSVTNIILKYPAALHIKQTSPVTKGNNVLSSAYNPFSKKTKFILNTNFFSNPFNINYVRDRVSLQTEVTNPLRDLTTQFDKYVVDVGGETYRVTDFRGSERETNSTVVVEVEGQPFDNGNQSQELYIRPLDQENKNFFDGLDDFERHLLTIDNKGEYSALFFDTIENDAGELIELVMKFTWPIADDFNLDVKSDSYGVYLNDLIEYAKKYDDQDSDLIQRLYVSKGLQNITLSDKADAGFPTYGKFNQVLLIYGRMFDEINRRITAIKHMQRVTYDKKDNRPDILLRQFASTLGWDAIFDDEKIDNEVWRRLILNTYWIWKGKGTRKAIEFVTEFFGIPSNILEFNEYVYLSRKPVDMDQLQFYLDLIAPNLQLNSLSVDTEGFPRFFDESLSLYFQKNGETDDGNEYVSSYVNLLPAFTGSSVTNVTEEVHADIIFNQAFINSGSTLGYDIVKSDLQQDLCFTTSGATVNDPLPEVILDVCGCPLPISDHALEIKVEPIDLYADCPNIVVDAWYECTESGNALFHVSAFGGEPPYTFEGLNEGSIVPTGQTFSVHAFDSNGCRSLNTVTGITQCLDTQCVGVVIDVEIGYTCNLDGGGDNDGTAIMDIQVFGGEPPYTFVGVQSGDTVNHGNIVTTQVIDVNGCTSPEVGVLIDCAIPDPVSCISINLDSTAEVTQNNALQRQATINVTYDLTGIPLPDGIDTVTMTLSNPFVAGTPVSQVFTIANGAKTIGLNFNPDPLQGVTINVNLDIVTLDGCEYTTNYNLAVNAAQLASSDFYNQVLNFIP